MAVTRACPALAVVGAHHVGKTTLLEGLIRALCARGLRIAAIKHHAHFERLDDPGTDTGRLTAAGAASTLLAGPCGMVQRTPAQGEPALEELLARVSGVDLVLVEGYSSSALPKILVRRNGISGDRPPPAGPLLAVAGDALAGDPQPHFAWDALDELAEYVARRIFPAPAAPSTQA